MPALVKLRRREVFASEVDGAVGGVKSLVYSAVVDTFMADKYPVKKLLKVEPAPM